MITSIGSMITLSYQIQTIDYASFYIMKFAVVDNLLKQKDCVLFAQIYCCLVDKFPSKVHPIRNKITNFQVY